MLVTFECKAYANITYFGDIAKQLLSMMGQSGTIPSAILADDVPKALAKLQQALEQHAAAKAAVINKDEDNQKETPVQITTRALPLIELLNAAVKKKCDVMWH
jgi:Domain of unknown function (DUF1840)